jgi:hypothetical protein
MDSLDYVQIRLEQLSENKIFIGLIMIMINIGARFIVEELGDEHKSIIKSPYFRRLVIFCSVFMATRDIGVAVIVTVIFAVLMSEVLKSNDNQSKDDTESVESTVTIDSSVSTGPSDSSFAKQELDKQIVQLTIIKDSL